MSRLNSKGKRGSRGFTVVELVVAMAIIVIVSATAIGLVNSQNGIYLRTTQTVEATNMAENAIECFRFAVENPDADGGVNKAFEDSFSKTFETVPENLYEFESNGMKINITITESESNNNEYKYKIDFNATDINGGKDILTKSYTYTK